MGRFATWSPKWEAARASGPRSSAWPLITDTAKTRKGTARSILLESWVSGRNFFCSRSAVSRRLIYHTQYNYHTFTRLVCKRPFRFLPSGRRSLCEGEVPPDLTDNWQQTLATPRCGSQQPNGKIALLERKFHARISPWNTYPLEGLD